MLRTLQLVTAAGLAVDVEMPVSLDRAEVVPQALDFSVERPRVRILAQGHGGNGRLGTYSEEDNSSESIASLDPLTSFRDRVLVSESWHTWEKFENKISMFDEKCTKRGEGQAKNPSGAADSSLMSLARPSTDSIGASERYKHSRTLWVTARLQTRAYISQCTACIRVAL